MSLNEPDDIYMKKNSKILIAGAAGMAGSAIVRNLKMKGFEKLLTPSSKELNLIDQVAVNEFFESEQPEFVFLAAGKVGGILDNNTFRAQFIYENIMIESNVIHCSYRYNVQKLLFLGSSCIYPKFANQPIKEEYLLSGYLEKTNQPYAIAKIAGIELCDAYRKQYGVNFISLMPTNLYGPNDHYDLKKSHVLPALLRKFMTAVDNGDKEVTIWGSGKPLREFLHVDDLAEACVFFMENIDVSRLEIEEPALWNIGYGSDISIADLATLIAKITGFAGEIKFDITKPDGTPRKLLDTAKAHLLGWKATINLEQGIKSVYNEIKSNQPW
jgi:GDP-L-fucose synthase